MFDTGGWIQVGIRYKECNPKAKEEHDPRYWLWNLSTMGDESSQ